VLRTFTVRDLVQIGKRLDRVAKERAEDAATSTAQQRSDAVDLKNRRLRELLRRKSSA
jgi:ABC-type hemin transport system ATPase subunit